MPLDETQQRYWQSLEDWAPAGEFRVFADSHGHDRGEPPSFEGHTRRDFLRIAGFTVAGSALAGCSRAPIEKAMPYIVQPEETVAGRAQYYASACAACSAGCGVLIKVRDGRPIKLEGNPDHPISGGALCAAGQASLLGLYDSLRLTQPLARGAPAGWEEVDRALQSEFDRIREQKLPLRYLSGAVSSPAKRWMIQRFLSSFPDAGHVEYAPYSQSAILDAHERTHGKRVFPHLHFDRADVIAAFDADFLGTWISPVEFARAWSKGRVSEGDPPRSSYHVQFEGRLTVTGGKADRRYRVAPDEMEDRVRELARQLAAMEEHGERGGSPVDALAGRLWKARGRSLVVSGSQSMEIQVLINRMNELLGNYGSTLDLARPSLQIRENDDAMASLVDEIRGRKVAALIVDSDVNPMYEFDGRDTAGAIKEVPVLVSLASRLDETASVAQWVCPDSHHLEVWGDAEPIQGLFSVNQPAAGRFGRSRPVIESLAVWIGEPKSDFNLVRQFWESQVFSSKNGEPFSAFWNRVVQTGVVELPVASAVDAAALKNDKRDDASMAAAPSSAPADSEWIVVYPKVSMRDVRHAYNPWLQELPDPVSRVTWDNYACVSPAKARQLGVEAGDVVALEADRKRVEMPVLVQPGMHDRVVAVALGYGAQVSARFKNIGPRWFWRRETVGEKGLVGDNVSPLMLESAGALRAARSGVRISKTGKRRPAASTQDHHRLVVPEPIRPDSRAVLPIVQETSLAALAEQAGRTAEDAHARAGLWPSDHKYEGHRWGMAIDMNACNGCSACVVACQVENNVPVVGKDEVVRHRIMHWIRIDRYYAETPEAPRVAFQPMMCQHCENAPCEAVCPTLATNHSGEGLNQQVYNRCVGTRYCANNCPYKVRRFNWFDYPREDRLANMVLNPDVTVRSRGVMEKCSFCVQRITDARIEAMGAGRAIADGDIQTACQQSCAASAIVFGDMNDPKSRVSRVLENRRRYHVLEELNIKPSVAYLKIVRDTDGSGNAG
ncbi:MAG: 4Fe-4S dicluster domain-containing protein [Acidobacteria bacterium]|nr:4Fe-4S dicluster domain-containing protein [Acidobacteriota bacterium]